MKHCMYALLCALTLYSPYVLGESYKDETANFDLNDSYLEELEYSQRRFEYKHGFAGGILPPIGLQIYVSTNALQEGYITACGSKMPVTFVPMKYRAPGLVWLGEHRLTHMNLYVPRASLEKACGI